MHTRSFKSRMFSYLLIIDAKLDKYFIRTIILLKYI